MSYRPPPKFLAENPLEIAGEVVGYREDFSRPPMLRDAELGPDMLALNARQRAFVFHLVELGGDSPARAAALAGYTGSNEVLRITGTRLAHDERIGRAMAEEAKRRLHSSAILAVSELHKMLNNPNTKDSIKLRVIEAVLNRTGLGTSQTHVVKHEVGPSEDEKLKNIRDMAQRLGLDASKLLGAYGVTIDGEFEEIRPADTLTPDEIYAITHDPEEEKW